MPPPKIMVIDDSPESRQLIRAILGSEGYEVLAASNGRDGVEAARREVPDLILLDILMPGESGFEICGRLKEERVTSEIPVIFLSGVGDVAARVTGLTIGAVDFISKPVCDAELLARVRTHLRIRSLSRAAVEEQREHLLRLQMAHRSLLADPAGLPEAAFAVYYQPLEEGGGDFYDVIPLASGLFGYFVADVSGHGIGASPFVSAIKALLREHAGSRSSPEATMRGIDAVVRSVLGADQYLTACYARLDLRTMRLAVVCAGHPPPILVTAAGAAMAIEAEGDPLGVFRSTVLRRREVAVSAGDRLFLYTDGLLGSSAPGRREEVTPLVSACLRHRESALSEAVPKIAAEARAGASEIADDLLLVGVDIHAPQGNAQDGETDDVWATGLELVL